jgi:hypothetical protein
VTNVVHTHSFLFLLVYISITLIINDTLRREALLSPTHPHYTFRGSTSAPRLGIHHHASTQNTAIVITSTPSLYQLAPHISHHYRFWSTRNPLSRRTYSYPRFHCNPYKQFTSRSFKSTTPKEIPPRGISCSDESQ